MQKKLQIYRARKQKFLLIQLLNLKYFFLSLFCYVQNICYEIMPKEKKLLIIMFIYIRKELITLFTLL